MKNFMVMLIPAFLIAAILIYGFIVDKNCTIFGKVIDIIIIILLLFTYIFLIYYKN